jgi:hypothetical protein
VNESPVREAERIWSAASEAAPEYLQAAMRQGRGDSFTGEVLSVRIPADLQRRLDKNAAVIRQAIYDAVGIRPLLTWVDARASPGGDDTS